MSTSKSTGRAPSAVRSTAPHSGHSSSAVKHTAGGSGRVPVTTPAAPAGKQALTRPTPHGGGKTPSLNISGVVPAVAPAVQPARGSGKSGRGPAMNIKTGKC